MSSEPGETRPDFDAQGLLEGVEGGARAARNRLLNRLYDEGVGLEELRDAVANDRLVILPAEHALGGDPRFSARQLSESVGVPLDFFLAVRRAQGLADNDPDEAVYTERDQDAARLLAEFYEAGFDRDGMLEAARVLGRGMAQLADALGGLFGQTFIRAGVTEEELGLRNAQAAREMLPRVTPVIEYALRQHMRERLRHQAVSQAMLEAGEVPGARDVAVAFADMVAFTRLGEQMAPEEVGDVAGRLGELASECARPPVRLVKTIGDAAMLVAPDAEALLRSTLELIASAERTDAFPRLRAGAAYGPALGRSGDWYGRPINVASRVTDIAEPGTVVGTKELCDAAGEFCAWTSVGTHSLKGIEGEVELFRAEYGAGGTSAG
jgi:adenylate cyclase